MSSKCMYKKRLLSPPFLRRNTQMAGHDKYTICDGYSEYFQIRITEEDQKKTTFVTPWGTFAYRVMTFGLVNAPSTFQTFMNEVFGPYLGKFIGVFIDDFCIYSSRVDHLVNTHLVLQRIDDTQGNLNPHKCHIAEDKVKLLGHIVSQDEIEMDPEKLTAIESMPVPKMGKQLKTFVQKVTYYERFLWELAQEIYPLAPTVQTKVRVSACDCVLQ